MDTCRIRQAARPLDHANGGYVSESVRHVAKGTAIGPLPVPDRAGFDFEGWLSVGEEGNVVQPGDIVQGDLALYAGWKESPLEWDYAIDGNSATVTGVSGAKGDLVVPGALGGCPVRSIGSRAFECCDALRKVKLPEGVTNIGERAFFYCRGMTGIEIPASTVNIGAAAFEGCAAMTKLWLPPGIEHVSPRAFKDCRRLAMAYLPYTLEDRLGEGSSDYVFADCGDGLQIVYYDPDSLYSIRFRRNDGSDSNQETLFVHGEKTRIPALKNGLGWVRPSYEFLGWATSLPNANAHKIWKQDWAYVERPVGIGKTLTVYAVWGR